MQEILDDAQSSVFKAHGVLSRLWRIILRDKNIKGHHWEILLDRWVQEQVKGDKRGAAGFVKSNLVKALAVPNMTWGNFLRGLQVLNALKQYKAIRFEVHLVHQKGDRVDIIGLDITDSINAVKTEEEEDENGVSVVDSSEEPTGAPSGRKKPK